MSVITHADPIITNTQRYLTKTFPSAMIPYPTTSKLGIYSETTQSASRHSVHISAWIILYVPNCIFLT